MLSPIGLCCVPAGDVSSPPSTATAANEAPSFHEQCKQSQVHAAGFCLRAVSVCVLVCARAALLTDVHFMVTDDALLPGLYTCSLWTCMCPYIALWCCVSAMLLLCFFFIILFKICCNPNEKGDAGSESHMTTKGRAEWCMVLLCKFCSGLDPSQQLFLISLHLVFAT